MEGLLLDWNVCGSGEHTAGMGGMKHTPCPSAPRWNAPICRDARRDPYGRGKGLTENEKAARAGPAGSSPCAHGRNVGVRRSGCDRRISLQALLELAENPRHRVVHPAVREEHVVPLLQVREEVDELRQRKLLRPVLP